MKKSDGKIFSALKLIEALYLYKRISYEMFRNILNDYKDVVDLSDFA